MLLNFPNALTCCNLICGCMATGAAFHGHFEWAFIMIILGAVFDFFDGMAARALGISSPIGKELDSLADVVTFGVAPSAMVFQLFGYVQYPEWLQPLAPYMPYTAFIMASENIGAHVFVPGFFIKDSTIFRIIGSEVEVGSSIGETRNTSGEFSTTILTVPGSEHELEWSDVVFKFDFSLFILLSELVLGTSSVD